MLGRVRSLLPHRIKQLDERRIEREELTQKYPLAQLWSTLYVGIYRMLENDVVNVIRLAAQLHLVRKLAKKFCDQFGPPWILSLKNVYQVQAVSLYGVSSGYPSAVALLRNQLVVAFTGSGHQLYLSISNDFVASPNLFTFRTGAVTNKTFNNGPALAIAPGSGVFLAWKGSVNTDINIASYDFAPNALYGKTILFNCTNVGLTSNPKGSGGVRVMLHGVLIGREGCAKLRMSPPLTLSAASARIASLYPIRSTPESARRAHRQSLPRSPGPTRSPLP